MTDKRVMTEAEFEAARGNDTVLHRGRQWVVTLYGMTAAFSPWGKQEIRLCQFDSVKWLEVMARQEWCDREDFAEAYHIAVDADDAKKMLPAREYIPNWATLHCAPPWEPFTSPALLWRGRRLCVTDRAFETIGWRAYIYTETLEVFGLVYGGAICAALRTSKGLDLEEAIEGYRFALDALRTGRMKTSEGATGRSWWGPRGTPPDGWFANNVIWERPLRDDPPDYWYTGFPIAPWRSKLRRQLLAEFGSDAALLDAQIGFARQAKVGGTAAEYFPSRTVERWVPTLDLTGKPGWVLPRPGWTYIKHKGR